MKKNPQCKNLEFKIFILDYIFQNTTFSISDGVLWNTYFVKKIFICLKRVIQNCFLIQNLIFLM